MGSDTRIEKLGNFAKIKGGKRMPKGKQLIELKNNHPYIRVRDINDGFINKDNLLYVPDDIYPDISKYTVNNGDLIISIVGTLGLVASTDNELDGANLTENAAKILIDDPRLDSKYLEYFLRSRQGKYQIRKNTVGSTQPKLPLYGIKNIDVPIPDIKEQKRIAHILGTFDDKIERNQRMNETLESIARALFKSWFVDFDPVRAKMAGEPYPLPDEVMALFPDELVESELGPIPKGWEVGKLGDEFNVTMGQSPPGSSYNEEGVGIAFYQGRTDFGFRYPSNRVYCTEPKRFAETGDTLVSVRAPVGDINMANEKCCIGRGVAAIRHKSGAISYTYYSMLDLQRRFKQFEAEGTVFGSINRNDLENFDCVVPNNNVVRKFEKYCKTLDENIYINNDLTIILGSTSENLLAKLLSSEI
jgi:type I restriction enzyme S subunit